jgi:mannose-6-phosphate isomerase-like protein (cupin superfamily)
MKEMLNIKRKIEKPWGYEIIWAETGDYVGKLLYIKEGSRLSLQYHEHKEETIMVLSGRLELVVSKASAKRGMETLILEEGETFHVRPHTVHRFCATQGGDVQLVEVSTNYLEDVVRIEDDFNR